MFHLFYLGLLKLNLLENILPNLPSLNEFLKPCSLLERQANKFFVASYIRKRAKASKTWGWFVGAPSKRVLGSLLGVANTHAVFFVKGERIIIHFVLPTQLCRLKWLWPTVLYYSNISPMRDFNVSRHLSSLFSVLIGVRNHLFFLVEWSHPKCSAGDLNSCLVFSVLIRCP